MLLPGGLPSLGITALQLLVDFTGMIDSKVVGEILGVPRIGEHSLVKDDNGVVGGEMLQAVGH